MTLNNIKTNSWAKITAIHLSWEARKSLMEMGVLPQTKIKLICQNPFGNIFLIQVENTHIALSNKLARAIEVEYTEREEK